MIFEKDAEEYAKDMAMYYESAHGSVPSQFEKYLRNAVVFGYERANEWHYPSKGELPIDKTEMLVYFKYADYEYPCKTFGFYNGHFWDTKRGDVSNKEVIAWKEIVLPKHPKEEKLK